MEDQDVGLTNSSPIAARARELFCQHQRAIFEHTDRLFGCLLVCEWLAAIGIALWVSPLAWAGTNSETHPHVWAAVLLGGAIISLPVWFVLFRPGRPITRHMVGCAQMLLGALLIHLTGGRIETHFHVFGSLAFLAFYRDWRVLITASAVVAGDHFLRGWLWPQSVYGVLAASPWRWLEHAGWVVFEDLFLIPACIRSCREMQKIAERQAESEESRERIEEKVRHRTTELQALNKAYELSAVEARRSEEKYRHTLNAAADPIICLDDQGLVLEVNQAAERLFGYQRAEMLGGPVTVLVPDRLRVQHETGLTRYLATGQGRLPHLRGVEFFGLTKGGMEIPFEMSLSVLEAGGKKYLTGILRDIRERKQVEENSAEQTRLATLTAEVGVALGKPRRLRDILHECAEAVVRRLDAAFTRIWTLSDEDQVLMLRASAGMYTHLDGPHGRVPVGSFKIGLIAKERKAHLTNAVIGDPRVGDQKWARREGMVAFAGYPLIVENRLVGVIALFARHTLPETTLNTLAAVADQIALGIDRKRSESARRRAHDDNRRLLASIPSIMISLETTGRITKWNQAAESTLGVSQQDALGGPLDALPIAWEHEHLTQAIHDCVSTLKPIRLEAVSFTRPDGQPGFLGISVTPVSGPKRSHQGVLLLGTDITERRNLETQLRQAQKLESIGHLAAGIAHEINTPIQYVGDNVTFLRDAFGNIQEVLKLQGDLLSRAKGGPLNDGVSAELDQALAHADLEFLSEEVPKAIDQALEGVGRVAKIVRAMKEFSHPDSDSKVAADLNRLIENTITVARNEWKYVAEVVTDLDPSLPPVPCLAGEFNQVILNLIVNAAHAIGARISGDASQKGLITISTHSLPERAEIRVKDNGTGIPEGVRAKVFDPFFTTKPVGKGTGQGLAIAHTAIVKKHGGTIHFETEMGGGTTFIIQLPRAE